MHLHKNYDKVYFLYRNCQILCVSSMAGLAQW